jgi:hypothetical protein
LIILLELINLACGGILAGIEVAIHYGIREPAQSLNEQSQLQFRQALVLRLRLLVPTFFVPAAVTGLAVVVLNGTGAGSLFRCGALACLIIWVATRVIGTVRINMASLAWNVAAPPKNWRALVDRAERFHVAGVWAALVAFAFFLTAMGLRLATQGG